MTGCYGETLGVISYTSILSKAGTSLVPNRNCCYIFFPDLFPLLSKAPYFFSFLSKRFKVLLHPSIIAFNSSARLLSQCCRRDSGFSTCISIRRSIMCKLRTSLVSSSCLPHASRVLSVAFRPNCVKKIMSPIENPKLILIL